MVSSVTLLIIYTHAHTQTPVKNQLTHLFTAVHFLCVWVLQVCILLFYNYNSKDLLCTRYYVLACINSLYLHIFYGASVIVAPFAWRLQAVEKNRCQIFCHSHTVKSGGARLQHEMSGSIVHDFSPLHCCLLINCFSCIAVFYDNPSYLGKQLQKRIFNSNYKILTFTSIVNQSFN